MTEVKCLDGKLYVKKHWKTPVNHILEFVDISYIVKGAHSIPVNSVAEQSINMAFLQSMNSAGGRCQENARCESMWARLKEELLYNRYNASKMKIETMRPSSGDISSAIGTKGESVLPTVACRLWLRDNYDRIPSSRTLIFLTALRHFTFPENNAPPIEKNKY